MRPQRPAARARQCSIRTQIVAAALAALLPTLAALAILTGRVAQLDVATHAVADTSEAIGLCNHLVNMFSAMQVGIRAYAISGDDLFLDGYRGTQARWPEAVQAAVAALKRDPAQSRRLAQVQKDANDFFKRWEERLASPLGAGDDQNSWFLIGEDEARMRRISATIAELVQYEEDEIQARLIDAERARRQVYGGAAAASVIAIGLLAALTAVLGRSIARPIQRVANAAQRLEAGYWDERVPAQGGRETRILATAFNEMTDTLREARAALTARNEELERFSTRLATANEHLVERQRETDDFLYVLSHDLRAPLINIQGFGKRLQAGLTALESSLADLAKSHEAGKHLGRMAESLKFVNLGTAKIDQLISRLLEIARLTTRASQHQWIDTEAMVHEVFGACRFQMEERGITATVGTLPRVPADPVQLNQVFTNLIDNAIKYMGDRPTRHVSVTATAQDGRYRFAVQDTGPGIGPKDQEKVFRMFARLAPDASQGEGIGLAAVRAIINRHGGRIWVESNLGEGSTFCFTLPRAPADASATAEAAGPVQASAAISTEEVINAN